MSRRDDATLLRDMIAGARSAVGDIQGKDRDSLGADHVRGLGLIKCVEIVGEAAGRVSPELKERHPAIPWGRIVGMRNRLVHGYFEIDYDQVWATLTEDLPPLIERLESILAEEFGE
jgi:uncharacterized protein with HEPN domain